MRISVVIPVYNRARVLERALASVAAQQRPADEVLVVDDGSSDESAAVAEAWSGRLPALAVLRQPNAGPGAARNRAIGRATGDWLAFLDSDDAWRPDKLAAMTAATLACPEADIVHSERSYHYPDGTVRPSGDWPAARMDDAAWLCGTFAIKTSTFAVRRALLDETSMLFAEDRRTCEDYHLFWPAIMRARSIAFLPDSLTEIHETDGSLTRTDNYTELLSDNIRIQRRVLDWAARREEDPRLRAALSGLQYRCAQDLLLARRARGQLAAVAGDVTLLATHLPPARTLRALASAALGRPQAKHAHVVPSA